MSSQSAHSQLIPTKKKREYLESLSEDEFRDRVIRPLFFRRGYGDGRDLCGPDEEGKDAIFTLCVPIGGTQLIAVQTKRGKLNLAAKASDNLLNAIAQIRTALNTTIALHKEHKKVYPDYVYLCASGKINKAAREKIVDDVSDPRVKFLDAEDLIPLIDEYLQELWLGIDVDIMPYFRAIKEYVEGDGNGDSLIGGINSTSALGSAATDSTFVPLNLFRTTVKRTKRKGVVYAEPKFEETPVEQILTNHANKILITGEAGSGKSTALLRVAYRSALNSIKHPERYKVPVLLRAIDIERSETERLVEQIDFVTRQLGGSTRSCFSAQDLQDGRLVLFVDGLDEIASHEGRERVVNQINSFSEDYPKIKVILTARPYQFVHELSILAEYKRYQISPLDWASAEKIVHNIQRGKPLPSEQRQELLRRMEEVHGIELNPLLVSVFAATSEYSKKDIPANITELFKKFTELMLGRWDEDKGLSQQYQARLKDHILCQIAFSMHKKYKTSIEVDELDRQIGNELKRVGYRDSDVQELRDEIVIRSGLLRAQADRVEFRHHLLQEFFAGRGIPKEEFVYTAITKDWWRRPIVFYFGENPNELSQIDHLVTTVEDSSPNERLETAMTIGLAVQACYLSDVDKKIELWKWVVDCLVLNKSAGLKEIEDSEKMPLTTFIYFYMNGRDSVALAHIHDWIDVLEEWSESEELDEGVIAEGRKFWLISALIEIGAVNSALEIVKNYSAKDRRHLLALHLGAFLSHEVRPLGTDNRHSANEICKEIAPKIGELRNQVLREFGSHLLELRKGKIEAVDKELTDGNDDGQLNGSN